jgi:uncharacterized protein
MNGELLLDLARASIAEAFGGAAPVCPDVKWLRDPGACFVTLRKGHQLRGCIGTVKARRSLFDDVVENAKHSAFDDPRFEPLSEREVSLVKIEVSVLTPPEPLEVASEEDALSKIRVGVDGLQLSWGGRSGLFIPAMWEQLPDARAFLHHLKRKAGLPGEWMPGTRLMRFTAQKFEEADAIPSRKMVAQA